MSEDEKIGPNLMDNLIMPFDELNNPVPIEVFLQYAIAQFTRVNLVNKRLVEIVNAVTDLRVAMGHFLQMLAKDNPGIVVTDEFKKMNELLITAMEVEVTNSKTVKELHQEIFVEYNTYFSCVLKKQ